MPGAPDRSGSKSRPGPERHAGPGARPGPDTRSGWYVYGVVLAGAASKPRGAGVDDEHPILPLVEGEVAAVASEVTLAEFGEDALHEHLSDLDWVEAVARAHQAVLEHLVMDEVTVLPMRMCTVYRTETSLRDWLRHEATVLEQAIAVLEHKAEWGVKVFVEPEGGAEASIAERDSGDEDADRGPGAAYLERLRATRDQRARAESQVQQAVAEIHERLQLISSDASVLPPHQREVSGHPGEMVLNGVYLVPDNATQRFHAAIGELRTAHGSSRIELQTTGPWPPYNFVPSTIGASS